ncbi:MAG: hypothetical protein AAFZ52_17800, partial [Bacteroidota bacterium]
SEGGCDFSATTDLTINPLPTTLLNLPEGPICVNTSVGADAGAVVIGTTYDWDIPGSDAAVTPGIDEAAQMISWSTPGRKYVRLTVTDSNSCSIPTLVDSIDVELPLQAPVVNCSSSSLTSVSFLWNEETGVDSFRVEISGQPAFFQDSARLTVNGLGQGEEVELTVTALGGGSCGNSPASAATTCTAGFCPTITVTPPTDADFCSGPAAVTTDLSATQSGGNGGGTFAFSGPGVTQDNGTFSFDPNAAGPGIHVLTAAYNDGSCGGTATFTYTVSPPPTADFTLNGAGSNLTVCVDEDFTVAYTGDVPETDPADFIWDFTGAIGTQVVGYQTYEYSFSNPGTYTITLDVTANSCTSERESLTVTVEAPLPAPVVICSASDLNAITFSWEAIQGATGYLTSTGETLAADELSYTVTGLPPSTSFDLTVSALSAGACGNSPASETRTCVTLPCPEFTLDRTSVPDLVCLLEDNETLDLSTVQVTGGTTGGVYSFGGPGVNGMTFNAAAAGGTEAGTTHTIFVDYTEDGPCDFSGSFEVTVFTRPAAFITEAEPTCQEEAITILIGSTNFVSDQNITVDWDGGIVQDDSNPDDNSYLLRWDTPGTKTVTATIVSNISGCPSLPVTQGFELLAPPIVRIDNAEQAFCLDGTESAVTLTASLEDGSTNVDVVWSGTGVESPTGGPTVFNPQGLAPG